MKNLFFCLFILSLQACINSSENTCERISLKDELLTNSRKGISAQTLIQSNTFPTAKDFFVYADSILVVVNEEESLNKKTLLEVRKLSDTTLIKKAIRKGNGPTEVILGRITNYNTILLLNDFAKQTLCWINVDSLIQDTQYQFKFYAYEQQCRGGTNRLGYNQIIYENPFCFKNKTLEIDNKGPRFILGDNTGHKHDYGQYKYYTFNVTGGLCLLNQKDSVICYASMSEPILEFYNFNLQKQKEILFPYKGKPQKFTYDDESNYQEVVFDEKIPYTFMSACYNDDFIYLSYLGNDLLVSIDMHMYDMHSYIIKADWNGKILDCISCGEYISTMSIGKNGLYCTACDKDGLPKLVKYELF